MKKRVYIGDGLAIRSYQQIAEELRRRIGWDVTPVRMQQVCAQAERKIVSALMEPAKSPAPTERR